MAYSLTAKPGIAAGTLMWDKAKDAHFCLCLHKDFATHETLWMLDKTKSTFLARVAKALNLDFFSVLLSQIF